MALELRTLIRGPSVPKDQGYAWFMLVMSFLSHSLHLGFTYAVLGNLTVAHKDFFSIDLQLSSLIGSVHGGIIFIFAPIASILVKKIGCRLTEILAGVCLILGVGLSALSSEPWHAFLLFGALAAIGVSNAYIATSEILALSFDKYKYLAFSIAVLGYYVGMVAFPVVSQFLLNKYGYSTAMGIMASFHIIHILAGISFCEPSSAKGASKPLTDQENNERPVQNGTSEVKDGGHDNLAVDVNQVDLSSPNKQNGVKQVQEIKDDEEEVDLKKDFAILLKTPKVYALLFNSLLWNLNVGSFLILINDFIINSTNSSDDEVALGITIIGIANVVGTIGVILVSRLTFDRLILHFCCTMTFAICTIIIAFSIDKVMFYAVAAVWGLAQGASIANLLGVINEFCKVKQLALLFGLSLLAEGIGTLAGTTLCGYISEVTEPRYGIIFAGCSGILGSFCILPVVIQRAKDRRKGDISNENVSDESIITKM